MSHISIFFSCYLICPRSIFEVDTTAVKIHPNELGTAIFEALGVTVLLHCLSSSNGRFVRTD